jgi:hypothetical protein
MQGATTPSTSQLSIPLRLLIAFVLGVLVGLIAFYNAQSQPLYGQWWTLAISAAVLLIAMLLSILFDPAVRQGAIAPLRPIISLLLFLLIASGIVGALTLLPAIKQEQVLSLIALALVPFAVGLAAAFTIGDTGQLGLAVVGALVAWLGAGIPIIIYAVLFYIAYEKTTPGGDGGIALPLTIGYVVIGFVVAALGGLVGGLLRNWFLGTPSTSPAQP